MGERRTEFPPVPTRHSASAFHSALAVIAAFSLLSSCSRQPQVTEPAPIGYHGAVSWVFIEDLASPLARFETVFWDPRDTPSLRKFMRETDAMKGKRVLEIGTGTGLLAV